VEQCNRILEAHRPPNGKLELVDLWDIRQSDQLHENSRVVAWRQGRLNTASGGHFGMKSATAKLDAPERPLLL
jgi:hypothetical protein